ncbi:tyrosine-type recombinase/integrase [Campylobacter sp. MIT 97-5078]|uniref:tyrosine-type recombinase/integrase n=1 Tax=Campylobacter sp. MIT 97-5078 TaxID=1548153 RepID=UPI00068FCA78|nr:site-specific integrase [Campylobacter sp. MIT 97-5078]TQR25574.1 site-specific integrase [Campylobacter sp. MIT 97-5078]
MKNGEVVGLIKAFLNEKSFLKNETKKSYRSLAKELLIFFKKENIHYISEFKREHSISFVMYLKEKKNANNTIYAKIKFLKSLLRYAVEIEVMQKFSFAKFELKDSLEELERKELKPFNLEQIKELIMHAKGELRSYLIIGFFTGARTGEILALKKEDIDIKLRKAYIRKSLSESNNLDTTKNLSSHRKIDLLPVVLKELQKLIIFNEIKNKEDDFLIKKSRYVLRKEFKALQNKLNIKPIRKLYNTRHSFASLMLSKGEESMWISRVMLGHSSLNTTFKYYAKYLPQNVENRALFLSDLAI